MDVYIIHWVKVNLIELYYIKVLHALEVTHEGINKLKNLKLTC
jgi:hypothetical protein